MTDLGFFGYPFTWNNKRPGQVNTRQRLDHVVANVDWRAKFLTSTFTHPFSHASVHLPIILQTKNAWRTNSRSTKGFKFEEAWLLWDDCEGVIQDAWSRQGGVVLSLRVVK